MFHEAERALEGGNIGQAEADKHNPDCLAILYRNYSGIMNQEILKVKRLAFDLRYGSQ